MALLPPLDLSAICRTDQKTTSLVFSNVKSNKNQNPYERKSDDPPNSAPYRLLFSSKGPSLPKAEGLGAIFIVKAKENVLKLETARRRARRCSITKVRLREHAKKATSNTPPGMQMSKMKHKKAIYRSYGEKMKAETERRGDNQDEQMPKRQYKRRFSQAELKSQTIKRQSDQEEIKREISFQDKFPESKTSISAFEVEKERLVSENEQMRITLGKLASETIEKADLLMQLESILKECGSGYEQQASEALTAAFQKSQMREKVNELETSTKNEIFKHMQLKRMELRYREICSFSKLRNEKASKYILYHRDYTSNDIKARLTAIKQEVNMLHQTQEEFEVSMKGDRKTFLKSCQDKKQEMEEKREIHKEKLNTVNRRRLIKMKPSDSKKENRKTDLKWKINYQRKNVSVINGVLLNMRARVSKFEKTMRQIQQKTGYTDLNEIVDRFFTIDERQKEIENDVKGKLKVKHRLEYELDQINGQLKHIRSYGVESVHQVNDISEREMEVSDAMNSMRRLKSKAQDLYSNLCITLSGFSALASKINVNISPPLKRANIKALLSEKNKQAIPTAFDECTDRLLFLLSSLKPQQLKNMEYSAKILKNYVPQFRRGSQHGETQTGQIMTSNSQELSDLRAKLLFRSMNTRRATIDDALKVNKLNNIRVCPSPSLRELNQEKSKPGESAQNSLSDTVSLTSTTSNEESESDLDDEYLKEVIGAKTEKDSETKARSRKYSSVKSRKPIVAFNARRRLSATDKEMQLALAQMFDDTKNVSFQLGDEKPCETVIEVEKIRHLYKSKVFRRSQVKIMSGQLVKTNTATPKRRTRKSFQNFSFRNRVKRQSTLLRLDPHTIISGNDHDEEIPSPNVLRRSIKDEVPNLSTLRTSGRLSVDSKEESQKGLHKRQRQPKEPIRARDRAQSMAVRQSRRRSDRGEINGLMKGTNIMKKNERKTAFNL